MMDWKSKLDGLRAVWAFDNRWQLAVNRVFFASTPCLMYRLGDLEFLVDQSAGDASGTRLCLTTDLYRRFLPHMKLPNQISVFDLGANGGGFPLLLLAEGYQLVKLVCVEMNPNTFRRLQFNIQRNVRGGTHLINGALCGTKRRLELRLGAGTTSDSIYRDQASGSGTRTYSIDGYTLDELYESHFQHGIVDICKMDVEGAEYEVFDSPSHIALKRCRYLIAELHSNGDPSELIRQLEDLGFAEVRDSNHRETAEHLFANRALGAAD